MTAVVVATVLGGLLTMYMMPDLNEEITTAEFITSYVASRQVSVIWVTVVLPQNIVPQNGDRRPGPKHLAPEHYAQRFCPSDVVSHNLVPQDDGNRYVILQIFDSLQAQFMLLNFSC